MILPIYDNTIVGSGATCEGAKGMEELAVSVVRNHKDRVFRMLYKDKQNLLELYNALNETDYRNPEELEITTLENAIYVGMKNDVSFLLGSELNLYEHQASFNPNMPLRDLFYVTKQLEKLTAKRDLYSSPLIKLPMPRFIVFYNGSKECGEKEVLLLSNSYEEKAENPDLELRVTMLNINYGYNSELMEKCHTLSEYSQYVEKVREYERTPMAIEEAVPKAVDYCIRENILRDFLETQKAEVIAMSIFEYNEEKIWQKMRESNYQVGKVDGIVEGKAEGKADALLTVLESKGEVSEMLRSRIRAEKDEETIQRWLVLALKVKSLEEFSVQM